MITDGGAVVALQMYSWLSATVGSYQRCCYLSGHHRYRFASGAVLFCLDSLSQTTATTTTATATTATATVTTTTTGFGQGLANRTTNNKTIKSELIDKQQSTPAMNNCNNNNYDYDYYYYYYYET
jgi:hypothetical protein